MSQADEANPNANAEAASNVSPDSMSTTDPVLNDPAAYDPDRTHLSCIESAVYGIVLAGALYPICLYLIFGLIFGLMALGRGSLMHVYEFFLTFVYVFLIGGLIGIFISSVTGAVSVVLVLLINRSLGYPINEFEFAMSAGSMAGYMPTVFVVFSASQFGGLGQIALSGALGPLLAMTMGAIGATWSARKWGKFDLSKATDRKYSLSVFHLMMATMWIAVTFAIANAFGGPEFAIAVAGWFVLQAIMIAIYRSTGSTRLPSKPDA